MNGIDDALADGLNELGGLGAATTPVEAVLERVASKRQRRRRARLARRTALAVVVLVGGSIGVRLVMDGDRDSQVATKGPGDEVPEVADDLQAVSYHGIEVLVPADWRVNNAHCGTPQGDTVMVATGGAVAACLVAEPPGLTVVNVSPLDGPSADAAPDIATEPVAVGDKAGRRGEGRAGPPGAERDVSVLVLPDPGVVITVRGPDRALRERILDDVRVTPVDSNGCPDRVASLDHPAPSGRAGAAEVTVPGAPISVSRCSYEDLWLSSSVPPLTGTELQALVDLLNGLPEGVTVPGSEFAIGCDAPGAAGLCAAETRRGFVLRFDYASGPPLTVHVRISGIVEMAVANGDRTTKLSLELLQALIPPLSYGGGFPDPRNWR